MVLPLVGSGRCEGFEQGAAVRNRKGWIHPLISYDLVLDATTQLKCQRYTMLQADTAAKLKLRGWLVDSFFKEFVSFFLLRVFLVSFPLSLKIFPSNYSCLIVRNFLVFVEFTSKRVHVFFWKKMFSLVVGRK